MRRISGFLVLLLVIVISGCSQNNVDIQGEVSSEFYMTMGYSIASPIAYRVDVVLKNIGNNNLIFDECDAVFTSGVGTPLIMRSYAIDQSYGKDGSGDHKESIIEKNGKWERNFTTNGYTFDLLADADGRPMKFYILLTRQGEIVAGPYVAVLPKISELPSYERSIIDGNAKLFPMTFKKIEKDSIVIEGGEKEKKGERI